MTEMINGFTTEKPNWEAFQPIYEAYLKAVEEFKQLCPEYTDVETDLEINAIVRFWSHDEMIHEEELTPGEAE